VLARGEDKIRRRRPGAVAGEGAGGFLDVVLGVVALAQDEQFEQLAGKVLVRRGLLVLVQVQVDHHRRRARHRLGEVGGPAQAGPGQQVEMPEDQVDIAHLVRADDVDVAQEQRPFGEGRVAGLAGILQPLQRQVLEGALDLLLLLFLDLPARVRIGRRADAGLVGGSILSDLRGEQGLGEILRLRRKEPVESGGEALPHRAVRLLRPRGPAGPPEQVAGRGSVPFRGRERLPGGIGREGRRQWHGYQDDADTCWFRGRGWLSFL
jgi:hypothetical protein